MQREAGIPDSFAERAAAAVRDHLIEQHRLFFPFLPFIIVGVVDPDGALRIPVILNGQSGPS